MENVTPSKKAEQLLKKFKIVEPFVDVEALVKKMDIDLEYDDLDDEISGFLIFNEAKSTIVVNSNHHPNRQRFTIAHEIGHFELHAKTSQKELFVDRKFARDMNSSTGEIIEEKEANSFAAELLMPEKMLRSEMENSGMDFVDDVFMLVLARKFRVSDQALGYRLGKLGLGLDEI